MRDARKPHLIDTAEVLIKMHPNAAPKDFTYFGLSPLNLPDVIPVILHDGELYQRISPSLQRRLYTFINSKKNYQAAFVPGDNRMENMGILRLLSSELKAEQWCLELELEYQSGKLTTEEHEKLFNEALSEQTMKMLGGK
jgi:hypothetical protein